MKPQGVEVKVAHLLQQAPNYQYPQRLLDDVTQLLKKFDSFVPNVNSFAVGSKNIPLFYLYGTLPILYCGTSYNIPLTVFFDHPYPAQTPRCFVTPTKSMQIKPNHRIVDLQGVIYHPLLHAWDRSKSNLLELMESLAEVFSFDPPVYSTATMKPTQPISPKASMPTPARQSMSVEPRAQGFLSSNNKSIVTSPLSKNNGSAIKPLDSSYSPTIRFLEKKIQTVWGTVTAPIAQQLAAQQALMAKLGKHNEELQLCIAQKETESRLLAKDKLAVEAAEKAAEAFVQSEKTKTVDFACFLKVKDAISERLIDVTAQIAARQELSIMYEEALKDKIITLTEYLQGLRVNFKDEFKDIVLSKKIVNHLKAVNFQR